MTKIATSLPLDPDVERLIHDSFSRQGLMRHLGAELHEVSRGRVSIRLPFSENLTQQHGYFHAGGTSAIADSAGGYAGFTLFPPDSSVLTVEFKINLLAPGAGEEFIGRGKVVKVTRRTVVAQGEVFAVENDEEKLIAIATATLMRVADPLSA